MGKGQTVSSSVNWSRYSKSVEAGFTDPYFLDKSILLGGQIFRRDYSSFNYINNNRNTTYNRSRPAPAQARLPAERILEPRHALSAQQRQADAGQEQLLRGPQRRREARMQSATLAGTYLCDQVGKKLTSLIGVSTIFDDTDGIHPTRGQQVTFSEDFAGLGGDIRYLRTQAFATKYKSFGGWILSLHGEGGYIKALQSAPGTGPRSDPHHRSLLQLEHPRLRHSRNRPARRAHSLRHDAARLPSSTSTRTSTTRSAAGHSISRAPSWRSRSAPA